MADPVQARIEVVNRKLAHIIEVDDQKQGEEGTKLDVVVEVKAEVSASVSIVLM